MRLCLLSTQIDGTALQFDEPRSSAPQRLLAKYHGSLQHAGIFSTGGKPLQAHFHLISDAQYQLIARLRL
jgi:hypothetical protein